MRYLIPLATLVLTLSHCSAQTAPTPAPVSPSSAPPAPKSPAESLGCFQIRPGFRIELVAAEPDVVDPIAIAWGADGRLWVVEMGGYPMNPDGGRIRFLEDADRDGRYERSVVFLDGLSFPTGLLPWKNGVLVACSPDIFYAEDTTGDGHADKIEAVLTGFAKGNPQHQVNGLRFGLDNWIHCSNGDVGGTIGFVGTVERTSISGHDFAFCPRRKEVRILSGMSQFGRCRDDWGNWFGTYNIRPFWHIVLDDRYLRRNPMLQAPQTIQDVMSPPTGAPVYPVNRNQKRFNEPHLANRFTAACGIAVYRDELFGPEFKSNYFVCEPAYQLVRREVMVRRGVSFATRRSDVPRKSEFLASRDTWFRPVQARTGPDGALWVVDMYRLVIEHPEYMRQNHPSQDALRRGENRGRLYRIVPTGSCRRLIPRLDRMEILELVAALETPNGPVRDQVQQRIVEQGDRLAIDSLSQRCVTSDRPETRLAALATLDGLDAVTSAILLRALEDRDPAVRRHAVLVSESVFGRDEAVGRSVLRHAEDVDLSVRLQVACSLGQWPTDEGSSDANAIGQALSRLAIENSDQPFIITAILSSSESHIGTLLSRVLAVPQKSDSQVELLKTLVRGALFQSQEPTLATTLRALACESEGVYDDWQLDLLGSLLESLTNRGQSLAQWRDATDKPLSAAIEELGPVLKAARRLVSSDGEPVVRRVLAARLLAQGLDQPASDRKQLAALLVAQTPLPVQKAALETLVRLGHPDTPGLLLSQQRAQEPSIRSEVLVALASRTPWAQQLLDRIESGEIPAATITGTLRGKLLLHVNSDVRRRAGDLLQRTDDDRQRVIDQFKAAVTMEGSSKTGRVLFNKHCATCHRYRDEGSDVGPDLATLEDRSAKTLLESILDPNRSIAPRYLEYHAETIDGRVHSGILKSSLGDSIRLLGPDAKEQVLLRSELDYFESSDRSLMPADWEHLPLSSQDLADLIAYLRKQDE